MAFLRTLFWIVVTIIVVVFSMRNWVPVTIGLFGDLQADVKLPVLLLIAFLLGAVPTYLWQRTARWRRGRRTVAEDRTVAADPALAATVVPPPPSGAALSDVTPARSD